MFIEINASLLTATKHQGRDIMVGEASTLGLKPGEWPDTIRVVSPKGTDMFRNRSVYGNKADPHQDGSEDIVAMIYRDNIAPYDLHIIND